MRKEKFEQIAVESEEGLDEVEAPLMHLVQKTMITRGMSSHRSSKFVYWKSLSKHSFTFQKREVCVALLVFPWFQKTQIDSQLCHSPGRSLMCSRLPLEAKKSARCLKAPAVRS